MMSVLVGVSTKSHSKVLFSLITQLGWPFRVYIYQVLDLLGSEKAVLSKNCADSELGHLFL